MNAFSLRVLVRVSGIFIVVARKSLSFGSICAGANSLSLLLFFSSFVACFNVDTAHFIQFIKKCATNQTLDNGNYNQLIANDSIYIKVFKL